MAISDNTLVYCGVSLTSLDCKTGVSMRRSVATEVSRDVGKIGRAGVRDRFSVSVVMTDLGVSMACLVVSLTGVVFLELLVLIVALVDTELWVRGRYGDPVSGLVVFMTVSGTSGGAFT